MKKFGTLLALLGLLLGQMVVAQENPNESRALPVFQLVITPESLSTTVFEIEGSVRLPQQTDAFQLYLQKGQDYSFSCPIQDGRLPPSLKSFSFHGTSHVQHPRCRATGQEIYSLTRVAPHPELVGAGALYRTQFELPAGIGALTSDNDAPQSQGLVFQVAKFAAPKRIQRGSVEFEFTLPSDNLILYSRSVLGGAFDPSSLGPIGFGEELVEPLRLLVIAHEISHFWFGL